MNITIIGATGLVGKEFISILENTHTITQKCYKYVFISSSKSKGKEIIFKRKKYTLKVIDDIDFYKMSYFINCSNEKVAEYIKTNMNKYSYLIDNSSRYRLDDKTPLVIPHLNMQYGSHVFANPNCSTIILACLLHPLQKFKIKRVVVSTYQAASGAGIKGLEELELQMKESIEGKELTKDYWGKQYVNNVFVHNSDISDFGYNKEELKMIYETNKMFSKSFSVNATCIRVPVIRSHCESVNIEFHEEVTYEDLCDIIRKTKHLVLVDDKESKLFPDTVMSTKTSDIFVGHIRPDISLEHGKGWNFWLSGDQLIRGAAYNSYDILKCIVKNSFTPLNISNI